MGLDLRQPWQLLREMKDAVGDGACVEFYSKDEATSPWGWRARECTTGAWENFSYSYADKNAHIGTCPLGPPQRGLPIYRVVQVAQLSLATLMGKSRSNADHCSMGFARRVM